MIQIILIDGTQHIDVDIQFCVNLNDSIQCVYILYITDIVINCIYLFLILIFSIWILSWKVSEQMYWLVENFCWYFEQKKLLLSKNQKLKKKISSLKLISINLFFGCDKNISTICIDPNPTAICNGIPPKSSFNKIFDIILIYIKIIIL